MKRAILPVSLLLCFANFVSAQENPCLRRVLPVSVLARNEVPVAGLTAENFRASIQGTPVHIISASWSTGPRRIVLLLDMSDWMKGRRQWGASNKTKVVEFLARDFLQSLRSVDKVSLVTFADTVTQHTSLTLDRKLANAWVDKLAREDDKLFHGRSAVFDAMGNAIDILSPCEPGDAIYLITDSINRFRERRIDEMEERLLRNGVRVFATFLQDRDTIGRVENAKGATLVEKLFVPAGGSSWMLFSGPLDRRGSLYDLSDTGKKDIQSATIALYQQIERFYLMEIELPRALDKPQPWKLELNPIGAQQTRLLSLHYQARLLPCTATTKRDVQP